MCQEQYVLNGILIDLFKKHIPSRPTYTINGYPAFRNFYLISPYMDWEEFCIRVLLNQLDIDRAKDKDYSYFEGIGDVDRWELSINTKKNIEYFNTLINSGIIGCIAE